MNWYYRNQKTTVGPVSEADLDAMVRNGILGSETFVWQQGMPQWQRYREARGGVTSPAGGGEAPGADDGDRWHYVQNGGALGPISGADLDALVQSGTIPPETYVFRPGMTDWQPYTTVRGGAAVAQPVQPQPAQKPGVLKISAHAVAKPAAAPESPYTPEPTRWVPPARASYGSKAPWITSVVSLVVFGVLFFLAKDSKDGIMTYQVVTGLFSVVVGIMILVEAFRESVGQGFLTLCVPCYVLYYVYGRSESTWLKALLAVSIVGRIGDVLLQMSGKTAL